MKKQSMKQPTHTNTASAKAPSGHADPALYALFVGTIRDLYWAENHLTMVLPKMIASSSSKTLKNAISKHLVETGRHVSRLEEIFELLKEKALAKKCDAMEGLTKEGEAIIETTPEGTRARDIGIIFASQKVEHYEMASYTGAHLLATSLGYERAGALLQETMKEEQRTDELLSEMAVNMLTKAPKNV